MEKEKELEKILKYLASLGFEGPEIATQVSGQLGDGVTGLKLEYQKSFGSRLMLFDLILERKADDNGRYPIQLNARLRKPVEIERKVIDGIETAELDSRMAEINWKLWYSQEKGAPQDERIPTIMRSLSGLFKSPHKEGISFQQLLMYKHFPPELFDLYRKPDAPYPESIYEDAHYFQSDKWPYLSAATAYLYLSGGLDDLKQDVGLIMDGSMGKERLNTVLLQHLRGYPEEFQIKGSLNRADFFLEFSIPLARDAEKYFVGPYSLSITRYPDLGHGSFNGVSSLELESKMMAIDWDNDDGLFVFNDEERPEFKPAVEEVMAGLSLMEQDPAGAGIADLLRLKYHQQVSFLEHYIPQSAWELFDKLPKMQGTFPTDMKLSKARNLLEGSAVQYPLREGIMLAGNDWVRLSTAEGSNGPLVLVPLKGPNFLEIENMLVMLHILVPGAKGYITPLLDGARITVETELERKFQVQVDPEGHALKVWTMEGKVVPFNFHMDPDFTAGQGLMAASEIKQQNEQPKSNAVKNPQRKGPAH